MDNTSTRRGNKMAQLTEEMEIEALITLGLLKFMEKKWEPAFLRDFIKSAELKKIIETKQPSEVLEYLEVWVECAIEEIEDKWKSLVTRKVE